MNLLLFCQFTIRNMSIRIQNRFNRLRKRLKMRGEIFMKTKILALLMVIAALISLTACTLLDTMQTGK